jgi:hypothetical protein
MRRAHAAPTLGEPDTIMDWDAWEFRDTDPYAWPVPAAVGAIEIVMYLGRAAARSLYARARRLSRTWRFAADAQARDRAAAITTSTRE